VHETFGRIVRETEDGYGCSLTEGYIWISLDLDRLETVETHTLRGNHILAKVVRMRVFGNQQGMRSPTGISVLVGRFVRRIPSIIIVTVRATAVVIS
jgi:hypothetical protein